MGFSPFSPYGKSCHGGEQSIVSPMLAVACVHGKGTVSRHAGDTVDVLWDNGGGAASVRV